MDKKSKIIFYTTIIILAVVIVLTYYKIFVIKDYTVSFEVDCDPMIESCFIYECEPSTEDGCTEENPFFYYKLIEKNAYEIEKCDEEDTGCLLCKENESDCKTIYCEVSNENNCSTLPTQ